MIPSRSSAAIVLRTARPSAGGSFSIQVGGFGFFGPSFASPFDGFAGFGIATVFAMREPGNRLAQLLQRAERAVDQFLAELVRLLGIDEEPALGRLTGLEPIVAVR